MSPKISIDIKIEEFNKIERVSNARFEILYTTNACVNDSHEQTLPSLLCFVPGFSSRDD